MTRDPDAVLRQLELHIAVPSPAQTAGSGSEPALPRPDC